MSSGGYYMEYLYSLCRRRGWTDPSYEIYRNHTGYECLVQVNGREYQTDIGYATDILAQENAAMRAFMVCQNFSSNGGMMARNGIVQGLPVEQASRGSRPGKTTSRRHGSSSHHTSASHQTSASHGSSSARSSRSQRSSGHHSSSSSTASFE